MSGPFHPGELAAQARAGGGSQGAGIRDFMPDPHRRFYEALPFVVVAGVDGGGPIATLLDGPPGFVSAPDARTLIIDRRVDDGDPAARALWPGAPVGLLGIDLATRRRNRANGTITAAGSGGLAIAVQQAFGNCPQYIWPREAHAAAARTLAAGPLDALDALDDGLRAFITRADTFFVASAARTDQPHGGVDVSHRGGPPGFVHVDGDLLTIPDYRGNRYFNTLGNLLAEPRASLLFVDFEDGTLLQLQGRTEIVWDGPEVRGHAGAERLWRFRVARAVRRPRAVALRWRHATLSP